MVGRLHSDDPIFETFDLIGYLFYASSRSDWPTLSVEKISLSRSHLVPDTWTYSCSIFKTFCIILFSLILYLMKPFSYIFLIPHFYKNFNQIGSNFCVLNPDTNNLVKHPPPYLALIPPDNLAKYLGLQYNQQKKYTFVNGSVNAAESLLTIFEISVCSG